MIRIGVDFGGTKIEAAALDEQGRFQARLRCETPADYALGLEAVAALIAETERQAGAKVARVGVGGPGSPSRASGVMRNANSTQLNGRPFPADLARVTGRAVRYANDANCLALSEATDGAGAGESVVFAVILGTGAGAGVTIDGRIIEGRNGVAGEWGQVPLPWAREWKELAFERKEMAGDEKFFDLLEETLKDRSPAANERLAVFYCCLGLGLTGWYTGQPEYLRRKMKEIAARLQAAGQFTETQKICPDAYDKVDTRDLIEPPGTKLVGIGIALVGLLIVFFFTYGFLYHDSANALRRAFSTISTNSKAVANTGDKEVAK